MSISTLILGESGTGKTASLRNMKPEDVLLIQTIRKPMPFGYTSWQFKTKENPSGSIVVTDDYEQIIQAIEKTKRPIIIIDDWNFIMTNEFMRRSGETGYSKFSEIGRKAWELLMAAGSTAGDKRVYFIGHVQEDDNGHITAKSIGKMLTDKICIEAMFTTVLRTEVINGNYLFRTQNNGHDTVKSPIGMFETEHVENDLEKIDARICEFYSITRGSK